MPAWQNMRPAQAMQLAGLLEFPSCAIALDTAADQGSRQSAVDSCLPEWIGFESMQDTGDLQVVQRMQLGSLVHVFSHIQQTMHVELLTFQVSSSMSMHVCNLHLGDAVLAEVNRFANSACRVRGG